MDLGEFSVLIPGPYLNLLCIHTHSKFIVVRELAALKAEWTMCFDSRWGDCCVAGPDSAGRRLNPQPIQCSVQIAACSNLLRAGCIWTRGGSLLQPWCQAHPARHHWVGSIYSGYWAVSCRARRFTRVDCSSAGLQTLVREGGFVSPGIPQFTTLKWSDAFPEIAPAVIWGGLGLFCCGVCFRLGEHYSTPLLLPLPQGILLSLSLGYVIWLFEFRKRMCSF